jgi:hypothetical protein
MKTNQPMTNPPTLETFRDKWDREFKHQEQVLAIGRTDDRFWGGSTALKALRSAGALWIVSRTTLDYGDLMASIVAKSVYREVELYRCYRGVVSTNKAFDDTIGTLCAVQKRIMQAERQVPLPELKSRLNRRALNLGKEIDAIRARRESYWKEALLAEPKVRMEWPVELKLKPHVTITPIPPQELVEWEKILHRVRYADTLEKRIDLDSRFQKRLAIIFRFYFRFNPAVVPIITISRLVVLVYICADLAGEVGGHLMILDESGATIREKLELTVSAVDQKIRNIGL